MAKKSKKNSKSIIGAMVAVVLAVLGVILFALLPMVTTKVTALSTTTTVQYKGFAMIFGGKGTTDSTIALGSTVTNSTGEFTSALNVVALIAFLLVVIGIVGTIGSFFLKGICSKSTAVLSGLLIVVAGVLMFVSLNPALTALYKGSSPNATAEQIKSAVENTAKYSSLGIGAITGGIATCLSGLVAIAAPLIKK